MKDLQSIEKVIYNDVKAMNEINSIICDTFTFGTIKL